MPFNGVEDLIKQRGYYQGYGKIGVTANRVNSKNKYVYDKKSENEG